jgi:UDP-glucose 4-epimerase
VTVRGGIALVTGASGFVGREVVAALCRRGIAVRAGVRTRGGAGRRRGCTGAETVHLDLRDIDSVRAALDGVTAVYHFAAVMRSGRRDELEVVNVQGTEQLWHAAADCGVERALYCSTVSVYGLLAGSGHPIAESTAPRAIEAYGRAKLAGECAALAIGRARAMTTVVIRPAAVLGPGERSAFGRAIRRAALSRLLIPGRYPHNRFSYVHVADVAEAAVHVMELPDPDGEIFNVAVEPPISFAQAFEVYLDVLRRSRRGGAGGGGNWLWRPALLARLSAFVQRRPTLARRLLDGTGRFSPVFPVWQVDRELIFTSRKLLATNFRYVWSDFGDVLASCIAG